MNEFYAVDGVAFVPGEFANSGNMLTRLLKSSPEALAVVKGGLAAGGSCLREIFCFSKFFFLLSRIHAPGDCPRVDGVFVPLRSFEARRWTIAEIMRAVFGAGWPSTSALILSLTPAAGGRLDLSPRQKKVSDKAGALGFRYSWSGGCLVGCV